MGLIFTRSSSHISSFQLFIFFSGAACEVPLLGSLDQVAAHWQGARRVPGLPGELPQTGVGHWTKTKTNTKSQSQPKGVQQLCFAVHSFNNNKRNTKIFCRQSKSFLFRSPSCSRCLWQTSACARCSNHCDFARCYYNCGWDCDRWLDLSFQDYGVGQTAAEYINGAFNGQKGFKASLNHRNTRQMWDPVHPVKTFFSVYCWHCDRTFLLLKSPRSFVCYIFLPHRTRAMVWCV